MSMSRSKADSRRCTGECGSTTWGVGSLLAAALPFQGTDITDAVYAVEKNTYLPTEEVCFSKRLTTHWLRKAIVSNNSVESRWWDSIARTTLDDRASLGSGYSSVTTSTDSVSTIEVPRVPSQPWALAS